MGKVYEVVVFQAERHTCLSNYELLLSNFSRVHSECYSLCGDGVVAGDELCDDAPNNGNGHGFCSFDCRFGPRCGDGFVDAGFEQCDNGTNLDLYYLSVGDCAPGCVFPGYCGDAIVQTTGASAAISASN